SRTPAEPPPASHPDVTAPAGAASAPGMAPGSGGIPGGSGGFARLIDGFRDRLDREIAAFLADKRSSAGGTGGTGGAGEGPGGFRRQAILADPGDLVDGVARLMAQG